MGMKNSYKLLSLSRNKTYNKADYSEEEILSGIINNGNEVIKFIYKKYFTKIKQMVFAFRNTILIPEDIFQEGLTCAIINIRDGKFRGESSFYTYLNNICRNQCLKELSKIKTKNIEINDRVQEENSFDHELMNSLLEIRKKLNESCIEIIDLRFDLKASDLESSKTPSSCKSFDEIAELLLLTADNARQRFKRCLDKLKELVYSNTELKEYFMP